MKFRLDGKLSKILSEVSRDIAVAYFIAAVVSPPFFPESSFNQTVFVLTINLTSGTVFVLLSWRFAKKE